jgi:hypothetical protein
MSEKNSIKPASSMIEIGPADLQGTLKHVGGSRSDDWNSLLVNQTIRALSVNNSDPATRDKQHKASVVALAGIAPKDELEGMMAAQLIAAHNAAMECYRQAMFGEQTFAGWREALTQANKLSRTYAVLLDALNRHRGKGQQKVTVEHVHVHQGGQAIVGNVEAQGGGITAQSRGQPHAIIHAPGTPLPSADPTRDSVPVPSNAERPMPDARRKVSGRSER